MRTVVQYYDWNNATKKIIIGWFEYKKRRKR